MTPVVIRKNARESYRLAFETYEGHRFLDLRVYYTDAGGELKPTRKGVPLKLEALPEIIAALSEAAAASTTTTSNRPSDDHE